MLRIAAVALLALPAAAMTDAEFGERAGAARAILATKTAEAGDRVAELRLEEERAEAGRLRLEFIQEAGFEPHMRMLLKEGGPVRFFAAVREKLDTGALVIRFEKCGEANAFYVIDEHRILMCYELVDEVWRDMARVASLSNASRFTSDVTVLHMAHELAHALIRLHGLDPGRPEEDAADDLAALMLVWGVDPRGEGTKGTGTWMYLDSERKRLAGKKHHPRDPHSPMGTRAFRALCLAYGAHPERYGHEAAHIIGKEQAAACETTYAETAGKWLGLLGPYLKG